MGTTDLSGLEPWKMTDEDRANWLAITEAIPTPEPVQIEDVANETLKAQVQNAPGVFESEQRYRPQYAALDLRIMKDSLTGPGQMLQWYKDEVLPMSSMINAKATSDQRLADVQDIETMGARARAASEAANPEFAGMLRGMRSEAMDGKLNPITQELQRQAMEELALGSKLSPSEQRDAQQASRAAFSSRGMTGSNASIADEILSQYNVGQQRLMQRQQFGAGVAGLVDSGRGQNRQYQMQVAQLAGSANDPFMAILGRPGNTLSFGTGQQSAAAGYANSKPQMFNPMDPFGASVAASAAQQSASIYGTQMGALTDSISNRVSAANLGTVLSANQTAAMYGGIGSAIGGIFCWVAREVYEGARLADGTPKWMVFRMWMFRYAPRWFFRAYGRLGPGIADWIADKPRVKAAIRLWMDWKVKEVAYGQL